MSLSRFNSKIYLITKNGNDSLFRINDLNCFDCRPSVQYIYCCNSLPEISISIEYSAELVLAWFQP